MKKLVVFLVGVAVGFVVAHKMSETAQGKRLFDRLHAKKLEFCRSFGSGFKEREAQLRGSGGKKKS